MVTRLTYRNQSKAFLEQAHSELRAGDLRQVSEKGWGAASQMVKAVAESRGWSHNQHRLILRAVTRLTEDHGDTEIGRLFGAANFLHSSFYEGGLDEATIATALEEVARLSKR